VESLSTFKRLLINSLCQVLYNTIKGDMVAIEGEEWVLVESLSFVKRLLIPKLFMLGTTPSRVIWWP
jgi:hypothetical protein